MANTRVMFYLHFVTKEPMLISTEKCIQNMQFICYIFQKVSNTEIKSFEYFYHMCIHWLRLATNDYLGLVSIT